MAADAFDGEIMSFSELDNVVGGNYVELAKDLKFFAALGMIRQKDVPQSVNVSNFTEVNQLIGEAWQKFNITLGGNEGLHNTYTFSDGIAGYANTRRNALRYALNQSDRRDLNLNDYL